MMPSTAVVKKPAPTPVRLDQYVRVRVDISERVYAARCGSALMRDLTAAMLSPRATLTSTYVTGSAPRFGMNERAVRMSVKTIGEVVNERMPLVIATTSARTPEISVA